MKHEHLYSITRTAVLIHPSLPGFPLVDTPVVVGESVFPVATVLPPLSWSHVLRYFGIKQPRRGHIWPLRALLHLYLMVATRHHQLERDDASFRAIAAERGTSYPELLDQNHYFANFWPRLPEIIVLATTRMKEPQIGPVLAALHQTIHPDHRDEFEGELQQLLVILRAYLSPKGAPAEAGSTVRNMAKRHAQVLQKRIVELLQAHEVIPRSISTNTGHGAQRSLTLAREHAATTYAPAVDILGIKEGV